MTQPGLIIAEMDCSLTPERVQRMSEAIGTGTAAATAQLASFFGPTIAGEGRVLEALALDPLRATLGEHRLRWRRPFEAGEQLRARVSLEALDERGDYRFYKVRSDFTQPSGGDPVQTQLTTFVERIG